jgi:hypothetical protein
MVIFTHNNINLESEILAICSFLEGR